MFDIKDISSVEPLENITTYDPRNGEDKWVMPITFTLEVLDVFCSYSIDLESTVIPHASLINLQTLFNMIDTRCYYNNDSMMARVEFVKLVLDSRINLNIDKRSLILSHVLRNCDPLLKPVIENEILIGLKDNKITDDVAKYINTMVYETLVEGYSVVYTKKLLELNERKESGRYKRMSDYSKDFKILMNDLQSQMLQSEEYLRDGTGFDLSEKNIIREAKNMIKELKAPTNKLKLGIQYLNRMLNGGLEAGRSYLFMGITGGGKSIILLSIANWIRKFNKLPKKNNMQKQAVLFISQENSKSETFERLFNMNVSPEDLRNMSDEDILDGMRNAGMIVNDNDTDTINFIFKYFNDKEIGVSDIDALISDYERKGIQIIAVIQDYIEKLKPKFRYNELRYSLGSVATELSELAKKWKIPVVTAAQLNRMASSIVDNAIANNKKNTTKLLGKDNISESWDKLFVPYYSNIIVKMVLIAGMRDWTLYLWKHGCLKL